MNKVRKTFSNFFTLKNLILIFFSGKIISKLKPSKYLITFEKSINGYFIFFRKVREIQQKITKFRTQRFLQISRNLDAESYRKTKRENPREESDFWIIAKIVDKCIEEKFCISGHSGWHRERRRKIPFWIALKNHVGIVRIKFDSRVISLWNTFENICITF